MPVGFNAQGQLVNYSHKCECGKHLPLPEWAGKFCPKCGTKQPNRTQDGLAQELAENGKPKRVCPNCGKGAGETDQFCKECGTKIEPSEFKPKHFVFANFGTANRAMEGLWTQQRSQGKALTQISVSAERKTDIHVKNPEDEAVLETFLEAYFAGQYEVHNEQQVRTWLDGVLD